MFWVIAVDAEVVAEGERVSGPWMVFVVVPGMGKPVNLAHSGETHGLFHG